MASIDIRAVREMFPGKTDVQAAAAYAAKRGYRVILRYKSGNGDYDNFGCCKTDEEVQAYIGSPHCHHAEIIYDGRAKRGDLDAALFAAAAKGEIDTLRSLLKAGADPNAGLSGGKPILMPAAHEGNLGVVSALLEAGANPNVTAGDYGETALIWAADAGHVDVVRALLRAGADPNIRTRYGKSPLGEARKPEIVSLLLAAKADPNATAANGENLLVHVVDVASDDTLWTRYTEIVQTLLRAGANPNIGTFCGDHALALAACRGNDQVVEMLLASGADVDATTEGEVRSVRCRSALGLASEHGHARIVAALLKAGADVNAKLEKGRTALDFAVERGHKEVVAILSKRGGRCTRHFNRLRVFLRWIPRSQRKVH